MTQFVINQLPGDWNPAHDLSGKNQTFEQWAQQENIADAALGWNAYERGDTAYIRNDQKIADAKELSTNQVGEFMMGVKHEKQ